MGYKTFSSMTFITLIIGFMIAIQFQTVNEPVIRDTRDTMELRQDLLKEKEIHLQLIREINSNDEKLGKYETEMASNKEQVLKETLNELKVEAGYADEIGPGITIQIEQDNVELLLGKQAKPISSYLIQKLVNELNRYGAKQISIGGHRLVNSSVIRDINGETKVDGYSINTFPIELKITVDSMDVAEKLYNRMQVSESAEEFFSEYFRLSISEPQPNIKIPAYEESIRIRHMELVETE